MSVKKTKITKINFEKIPIKSSLGLLAYGDLAFIAWRKLKQKNNKK